MNFFHRLGAARYVLAALAVALVALGGTALAGVVRSGDSPTTATAADIAAAKPSDPPATQSTGTTTPTSTPTAVETAATKRSAPRAKPTATKHKRAVTEKSAVKKTVAQKSGAGKERSASAEKPAAAKAKTAAVAPKSVTNGPITRAEVLARARTWLTDPSISYSMNGRADDPNGVPYRSDCSGYASMALHLDAPGRSTIDLPDVAHVLSDKDDLKPGDLLGIMGPGTGGAGGHVMIFVKWNDDSHSSFTVWEHSGNPDRPHQSVHDWPIHDSRGAYLPYRYDKIVDGS